MYSLSKERLNCFSDEVGFSVPKIKYFCVEEFSAIEFMIKTKITQFNSKKFLDTEAHGFLRWGKSKPVFPSQC